MKQTRNIVRSWVFTDSGAGSVVIEAEADSKALLLKKMEEQKIGGIIEKHRNMAFLHRK